MKFYFYILFLTAITVLSIGCNDTNQDIEQKARIYASGDVITFTHESCRVGDIDACETIKRVMR